MPRAREKLGWVPRVRFRELVAEMVCAGLAAAEREALLARHGHRTPEPRE